ncbi:MAG TPA: glycoside hydrolase family 44 protein [Anaerolineaceae bacterium]|nr:glycoside hydrolase family 44 protein [Anaerolineaceae bacterium]HPN51261.1 glycoside hydrolase family 44 protein [Anaerolineaceae bacterium]
MKKTEKTCISPEILFRLVLAGVMAALALGPAAAPVQAAPAAQAVYADALAAEWANWSWSLTANFSSTSPVHGGSYAISAAYTAGWGGLQLGNNDGVDIGSSNRLEFWIHGGSSGGQPIRFTLNSGCGSLSQDLSPAANTWTRVEVDLSPLPPPRRITTLVWMNNSNSVPGTFYLDDIRFYEDTNPVTPPAAQPGPALSVDLAATGTLISPYIYGMNFASESLADELDLPVRRWGGNSTTRYNYLTDTSNRGSDWYFENVAGSANPANLPDGSETDLFIAQNVRTGAESLITIPLIGWTPKARDASCGFSVSKYGAQTDRDWQWRPDCGNGVSSGGGNITGNDPHDTSMEITTAFVQGWITYLKGRYGAAGAGGVRFYNLDNEPMLWNSTHRDVHPAATSYDELRDRTVAYAAAVKAADPQALTLGPVLWGWTAYFYSALDAAAGGSWWNNPQDRLAHGNVPFIEWYLQQMRSYELQHGTRILDFVDVHYYPQAGGIFSSSLGDAATQALRLRSTRALWDRTYTDESWIADEVYLIPRMKEWVTTNYPGTRLAVTEYNWGAHCYINGALAQADVLGIFGREGLDLATLWGPPVSQAPAAFAFRMFRNYDGAHSRFGDLSLPASSADEAQVAIFAAAHPNGGNLTLLVINKTDVPRTSTLALPGLQAGSARVFSYGAADLSAIHGPTTQMVSASFSMTFAPQSITLIEIPQTDTRLHLFMPLVAVP